jgi:Zn-dependent protease with chaperone function
VALNMNSMPPIQALADVNTEAKTRAERPAAVAGSHVARAVAGLGALGLASSLFVIARMVETWRVSAEIASRRISLLGQRLSYPVANFAAVVVLVLALLGLVVIVMLLVGAAKEFRTAARFNRLMASARLELLDGAVVIPGERPLAFCAGLLNPRVYVSRGTLELLDEPALQAVLAHERHHVRRLDPLRLAGGRVIVRALFFMPALAQLMRREQALAELSADEYAIDADPDKRAALATAMLRFSDASSSADLGGIDPARVDHLLGEAPNWRFPLVLSLASVSVVVLMATVAVLAGQVARGAATLAPPFLSSQPCSLSWR